VQNLTAVVPVSLLSRLWHIACLSGYITSHIRRH